MTGVASIQSPDLAIPASTLDELGTSSKSKSILRWDGTRAQEQVDELVDEEPLEIRVRGRGVSVTMRTPGHDADLAAGFLLSEGLIRSRADILKISACSRNEFGNVVDIILAPYVAIDFAKLVRHVFAHSSCGLCGKASIDAIRCQFDSIPNDSISRIAIEKIAAMPDQMRQMQSAFERTGGLHAAALFDESGKLLVVREDIGRHNAVDKVIGHSLLNESFPLNRHILLVSGRVSFELIQKSLVARIPIVAAVSAPSSLAVEFAQQNNQTLIGFLRENRMNIYSGAARIQSA